MMQIVEKYVDKTIDLLMLSIVRKICLKQICIMIASNIDNVLFKCNMRKLFEMRSKAFRNAKANREF